MKTRSKALYTYLLEAGVLNGTAAEIDRARCDYRKLYKKQWKENKRPRKEIRIEFTLKQFTAIKQKAHEYELRHTAYARQVILATMESKQCIPYREKLEKILQLVSMVAITATKEPLAEKKVLVWITQAESLLLQYLHYSR